MDPEEVLNAIFDTTGRNSVERRQLLSAMRTILEEKGDRFVADDIAELKELALEHTELVVPDADE